MNPGEGAAHFHYYLFAAMLVAAAAGRAVLIRRGLLGPLFGALRWAEVSVLGLLLGTLIVLGGVQIALRNFFHGGLLWADPLMRHIVLWLGCLGAALATTSARHINIDVFSRKLPAGARRWQRSAVYAATAFAAFLLGVSTWRLVLDERSFGDAAFGSVQVWVLQLVLPVAFFLISYRSMVNLFTGLEPDSESMGMEETDADPEPAKP